MENRSITIREALQLCIKNKIEITRTGLSAAGVKNGFARKNGFHWEFELDGLNEYISRKLELPEKSWVTVSDASNKLSISKKKIYSLVRDNKVSNKYFLSKNKVFVNLKDFKNLLKKEA